MKRLPLLLQLAILILVSIQSSSVALPDKGKVQAANLTMSKTGNKTNAIIIMLSQVNRRSRFPIIPPRLQLKTTTPKSRSTTTSATTTTTTLASNSTTPKTTTTTKIRIIPRNSTNIRKQLDIFEISSSDNSPSIAWPVPRRQAANRRMWTVNHYNGNSQSDGPRRPVPKLLLPKPTRPAMYSLDGFVPKPSMIRITTTEAPEHIKARYSNIVVPKTNKRKWYGRQSLDEDEEYRLSKRNQAVRNKSVSRYTAFKRKGLPGRDYPIYASIPTTNFDCAMKGGPGMYADPEAGCQVWHMCPGNAPHRYSFMCPNGTIFNENRGVCDWWYNVSCMKLETPSPLSTFRKRSGRSI